MRRRSRSISRPRPSRLPAGRRRRALAPTPAALRSCESDPHRSGWRSRRAVRRAPFARAAVGLELPVAWRARTWAEPERRQLRFVHVGGATGGMDVTWHIEPASHGSQVTIDHAFERALPLPFLGPLLGAGLWPAFIDRFFTRPIAGRTLATFKALAEAVAVEEPAPGRFLPPLRVAANELC